MSKFYRGGVLVALLLLIAVGSPTAIFAQDENTIVVTGSGIAAPLFETLVDAGGDRVDVSLTVTGTRSGFEAFCGGESDIVIANRAITVDEEARCQENGVEFLEFLGGHNILALIAHPDAEIGDCLTTLDLDAAYAPSSEGENTNWNQVLSAGPDLTFAPFVPPVDTPTFALLDRLVDGDGVRGDATIGEDDAAVVSAVATTEGALGAVSLNAAQSAADRIQILELDVADLGCAAPSAENVEGRLYTAADRLFFYVNPTTLDKAGAGDFLNFLFQDSSRVFAGVAGFTPVTTESNGRNREILTTVATGRVFSRDVVAFEIPETLAGQISIAGAALGEQYIQSLSTAFTSEYFAVSSDVQVVGATTGFRRLCNDEIDVVIAFGAPSDEQLESCEANNVSFETFDLGAIVVVLIANADTPFLNCLTTEQLTTVWNATSANEITNWSQVDSDFDDVDMTLFGPQPGSTLTDVLMLQVSGESLARRLDIELDNDPLFRAAATANVVGALTYMSWDEYQQVLDNNQANIQLVSVDAGAGCVAPTIATIRDGRYPLARQGRLYVNQRTLATPPVQSLLWFAMSDENFDLLENAGFVGIEFSDLIDIRDELQLAFDAAVEAAVARAAEEAEAADNATDEAPDGAASDGAATESDE